MNNSCRCAFGLFSWRRLSLTFAFSWCSGALAASQSFSLSVCLSGIAEKLLLPCLQHWHVCKKLHEQLPCQSGGSMTRFIYILAAAGCLSLLKRRQKTRIEWPHTHTHTKTQAQTRFVTTHWHLRNMSLLHVCNLHLQIVAKTNIKCGKCATTGACIILDLRRSGWWGQWGRR